MSWTLHGSLEKLFAMRQNQQVAPEKKIFFQPQKGSDMCRMHAINNALGRSAISREKFFAFCDAFDLENNVKGSRQYFFMDSGDNALTFILKKMGIRTQYFALGEAPRLTDDVLKECTAYLLFSGEHIWAHRKVGKHWWNVDSLYKKPERCKPWKQQEAGLGCILLMTCAGHDEKDGKERKKAEKQRKKKHPKEEEPTPSVQVEEIQSPSPEVSEEAESDEEEEEVEEEGPLSCWTNPFLALPLED